jgi:hypothetical protein
MLKIELFSINNINKIKQQQNNNKTTTKQTKQNKNGS